MKHFLITAALIASCLTASAQDYEPTSTWPYIYGEFTSGKLIHRTGNEMNSLYNVHIPSGKLHFIEGDMIREMSDTTPFSVEIGGVDIYRNVNGKMMKVIASSANGLVVKDTEIDMARLNSSEGAYGSSSNSSATTALSSIVMEARVNVSHMELKNSKSDGQTLPLVHRMYLVVADKVLNASKKDVLGLNGIDRKKFDAFCKKNKIRWRNPESLLLVIDYIADSSAE